MVNNDAPHVKHHISFNSTQSLLWTSTFSLARLYYTKMSLEVTEFDAGIRLDWNHWLSSYVVCLNLVQFTTPITMTLTLNTKYEDCFKVLINTFDKWDNWNSTDATFFDWSSCQLSSGADWIVYKFYPYDAPQDTYWFGTSVYD